jgi:nucleoside-triphosphatase
VALLLTGRPGIGKTTVVRATARKLTGLRLLGFYTEEIRHGSARRGFRLITFESEEAVIAHVDLPRPRVSKYGVDVTAIDRFAAIGGRCRGSDRLVTFDEHDSTRTS